MLGHWEGMLSLKYYQFECRKEQNLVFCSALTHWHKMYKVQLNVYNNKLVFFNQSWTSERGKGVPESPVFLGEEAGQLCP